jgi:hypothetical protein
MTPREQAAELEKLAEEWREFAYWIESSRTPEADDRARIVVYRECANQLSARLRAVLASWTPEADPARAVAQWRRDCEKDAIDAGDMVPGTTEPAPTTVPAAGCDESGRGFCSGCGDSIGYEVEIAKGLCLDCMDAPRRVALVARARRAP